MTAKSKLGLLASTALALACSALFSVESKPTEKRYKVIELRDSWDHSKVYFIWDCLKCEPLGGVTASFSRSVGTFDAKAFDTALAAEMNRRWENPEIEKRESEEAAEFLRQWRATNSIKR